MTKMASVQAAIVAGGRGERLRPATDQIPKPMLPVGGKPLMEHLVRWLGRSGVGKAFLCLGYKPEAFEKHFGDGAAFGLKLEYRVEEEPRGTAGCVRDLEGSFDGDLLVVYGDLYVDMDLGKLMAFHRAHGGAATLVVRETDHPLDSDLVRTEGDRITGIYRAKAGEPHGSLGCAAIWVVRPSLLKHIPADKPTDFGKQVFPAAIAAGEKLYAYVTKEDVLDVGTPERVKTFEKRWGAKR
ncbi:MAG: nucleotidyltransferase family protein [Elusimicrobia bacterium]|nr:nucleotidyltransferase family protein [Elusimicrobiota bacterium]